MFMVIVVAFIGAAASHKDVPCHNCIKVNSICHSVTHLLQLEAPFRNAIVISKLGILRSKNLLYFSFEPIIADPEYSKVGYVNLDQIEVTGVVSGTKPVYNLATFDIDQDNDVIYFGGGDGIYHLDENSKPVFYSSRGDTIISLFYKGNVFFVTERDRKIVQKKADEFYPYPNYNSVKNFVIDKKNVMVFLNNSGLYINKFNTDESVRLSNNAFFRGLTIDLDNTIYAWWVDGLYRVFVGEELDDSKLVKVADIRSIGGLTFDNDNNVLFTSGKSLFKLTETNTTMC